ncbi:MAG: hypothetical protein R3F59_24785 [Myxococcota bacterium]
MWHWAIAAALAVPPEPPDPRVSSEARRLSEEIEQLAARNAWTGVERTFLQLRALDPPERADDWLRGAESARARGDMGAVRERLARAAALRPDPAVDAWLADLDGRYGRATLRCERRRVVPLPARILGRPPAGWRAAFLLEAEEPPFDPDLVRAIAFARDELARTGAFAGLLPVGRYRMLGTRFGVTDRLEADLDLRSAVPSRERLRAAKAAGVQSAPSSITSRR